MRISDWSSDVCSSDLRDLTGGRAHRRGDRRLLETGRHDRHPRWARRPRDGVRAGVALHLSVEPADAHPGPGPGRDGRTDRKSVVQGKSVSVRVDLGGRRIITTKYPNVKTKYTN